MSLPRRIPASGVSAARQRWPLVDTAAARALERTAQAGAASDPLMSRAARACRALARAIAPHAGRIWVAAGPGNNGGDGMEAAALLAADGLAVTVTLCAAAEALPADARRAHALAVAAGVRFADHPPALAPSDLALDALLGIGADRAPTDPIAALIAVLNALPCQRLAIDLPSGLSADTGRLFGAAAVRAQATLTLLTLKPGLYTAQGRDHAGAVWFHDLGVGPAEAAAGSAAAPCAWLQSGAAPRTPRRHAQHKGSFGDVAIVAGDHGMVGAALLAGRAAQAAGPGRVHVSPLAADGPASDPWHAELLFRPRWWEGDAAILGRTTVVCGCGGGAAVAAALLPLLAHVPRLVLDADALNAVASSPGLQAALRARAGHGHTTVLTPHPLEAARLAGTTTEAIQADRLAAAQSLAEAWRCVVVLKGSGSVVAAAGRVPIVNASGNARLATAGTGDVLAGWIGGLWAQQPHDGDPLASAHDLVADAVDLHGAAAAPDDGPVLRAGELIARLQAGTAG